MHRILLLLALLTTTLHGEEVVQEDSRQAYLEWFQKFKIPLLMGAAAGGAAVSAVRSLWIRSNIC